MQIQSAAAVFSPWNRGEEPKFIPGRGLFSAIWNLFLRCPNQMQLNFQILE
jgi:hypothetical protein